MIFVDVTARKLANIWFANISWWRRW